MASRYRPWFRGRVVKITCADFRTSLAPVTFPGKVSARQGPQAAEAQPDGLIEKHHPFRRSHQSKSQKGCTACAALINRDLHTVILQILGPLKKSERSRSVRFRLNFGVLGCCRDHSKCFSHLGVFLISVKPLTTENTENKTTTEIL